ncbi:MAG: cytochrome c biogenesis protein CcdA [Treponema sp.]|jgi:cytochrome c-type biogenesis protein|nr:cytochrome c biogenesis protein CcdA [Treponema sp.]
MTEELSFLLVFAAGLLSFLSPCVLPLIPSYLSILGGVGFNRNQTPTAEGTVKQSALSLQPRLVWAAVGFVLGFSTVFIILGILVSTTFSLMGGISRYINWAAGIIVIVLGLNIIFDFLSFLNYEKRPLFQRRMRYGVPANIAAAFAAGAAFGAGWTPCIGPILTAILLMAGQSGKTGAAVFYLAVYSAGLALPFILAAVFFDSFLKHGARLRLHLPLIRRISGILLCVIGLMILTGQYSALNILIQKSIFSYIDWAETKALPFRLLANALAWNQKF